MDRPGPVGTILVADYLGPAAAKSCLFVTAKVGRSDGTRTAASCTNGLAFAGQMLIPVYLIRGAGQSPSATGWLMAPLGRGMLCTYPSVGKLTQHFGIRGTSPRGALTGFLATLPFLYLSSQHFNLAILVLALFVRGIGMSAVVEQSASGSAFRLGLGRYKR